VTHLRNFVVVFIALVLLLVAGGLGEPRAALAQREALQ
jgi:hypothetical protein